jgi:hypothetical protein
MKLQMRPSAAAARAVPERVDEQASAGVELAGLGQLVRAHVDGAVWTFRENALTDVVIHFVTYRCVLRWRRSVGSKSLLL